MKVKSLPTLFQLILVSLLLSASIKLSAQQVSPLQTGHYSTAFSGVRDMAKADPGFFVIWYNQYTFSNTYYDRNGNKKSELPLSDLDPSYPNVQFDVELSGLATAPAFFLATKKKILGATYMAGFVPVYFWANASFSSNITDPYSGKLNGIADFYFAPVTLSWGTKKFDWTLAYGFTAPTGRYETGADDNIGLGFWTHQVQGFSYFYPVEDQSTALMLGLTYEMNTKVSGEDYNPGNRLSLEWGISQYLSERLEVSFQGGHNWQVVDDKGADATVGQFIHDKKSTLAFAAGYWAWAGRLQVNAKYGFDFGMVQRFKTNMLMLNLTFVAASFSENG